MMRFEKNDGVVTARSFAGILAVVLTCVGRALYWAAWPGIHLILQNSERTRVILLSMDGRCLVTRPWLGDGRWKLPGGGIARDEKPAMAAARELREELGVHLSAESLNYIQGTVINERGHVYRAHVLGAHLDVNPSFDLRRWEIAEIGWLEVDEALRSITDSEAREAVRLWAAG